VFYGLISTRVALKGLRPFGRKVVLSLCCQNLFHFRVHSKYEKPELPGRSKWLSDFDLIFIQSCWLY